MKRIVAALAGVLGFTAWTAAGLAASNETGFQRGLHRFLERDVDVIAVTDVTVDGKLTEPASPAKPVRYMLVYLGETIFGRTWAGESRPTKKASIDWIVAALQSQGYVLADETHPPELLCVFAWGMLQGGEGRPALKFLGGDKMDLMWEQEGFHGGVFDPMLTGARVLTRGINRTPMIAAKIWDYSESDLFLGIVRAYTHESATRGDATQLWETRFACPAAGLALSDAMPLMIKAAAVNFGRETVRPVTVNASDVYGGHVELGELQVLGTAESTSPTPAQRPAPAKDIK